MARMMSFRIWIPLLGFERVVVIRLSCRMAGAEAVSIWRPRQPSGNAFERSRSGPPAEGPGSGQDDATDLQLAWSPRVVDASHGPSQRGGLPQPPVPQQRGRPPASSLPSWAAE